MVTPHLHKFQRFPLAGAICFLLTLVFYCPQLLASQPAMVLVDRAIIYADKEMTSPIGYIARGKKITVGEIPRNKAQVYPIVVSGKIAYVRVIDVTTEKASMDTNTLTAERFMKSTKSVPDSKFVLGYYSFASIINLSQKNGEVKSKDPVIWHGLTIRGEIMFKNIVDFQIVTNVMQAKEKEETVRAVEFGIGGALRFIDTKKFVARLEGQALAIPFSSYELGNQFRVNSYGLTFGGGLNLTYFFNKNWGTEAFGGAYYTRLLAFDAPLPYRDFSASFTGGRFGLAVNYLY